MSLPNSPAIPSVGSLCFTIDSPTKTCKVTQLNHVILQSEMITYFYVIQIKHSSPSSEDKEIITLIKEIETLLRDNHVICQLFKTGKNEQ